MKLPIPVSILTGALGVGKTTAVTQLLRRKPPNEKWALLVNEFGALGIDAALIEASIGASAAEGPTEAAPPNGVGPNPASTASSGVVVRELAGGCLCCTLSGPLGVAIAQLVRQAKPDRLIIEPSGLGHPAGLLDTLYGDHLRAALDVKAVICLVDVRAATAAELAAGAAAGTAAGDSGGGGDGGSAAVPNETFQDQINVADVVVGHKADLATLDQLSAFWRWAEQLYPPKAQVVLTSHGHIDPALLDMPRAPVFRPLFNPQGHISRRRAAQRANKAPVPFAPTSQLPLPATAAAAPCETTAAGAASSGMVAAEDLAVGYSIGTAIATSGEVNGSDEAVPPFLQLQPGRPLRFPSSLSWSLGAAAPPSRPPSQPPQQPPPQLQQAQGQEQQQAQQQLETGVKDSAAGSNEAELAGPREVSCGWLFSSEEVFDRDRLVEMLGELWGSAARLKGIFRVGKITYVVPYLQPGGTLELRPVSYRRESRLEVIVRAADDDAGGNGATVTAATTGRAAVPVAGAIPAAATSGGGDNGSLGLREALKAADWDAVESALLATLKRGP